MYYRCLNCNGAFEAKVFPMMPCETCLKDKWMRTERNRIFKDAEIYRSGDGNVYWRLDKEANKFVVVNLCEYCGTDPGTKPNSETMWNGFQDADTGANVCFKCREIHYKAKFKMPGMAGLYSELPVSNFKLS